MSDDDKHVSKHQRAILNLSGLTMLTDVAAKYLSKHEGDLHLNGITTLSDAAADSLSKHKGQINWEDPAEWADSMREG